MSPVIAASLLGGVLALDNRSSLRLMISQPICGGLLTGLALGAPSEGFMAGGLLQMMFIGCIPLRGRNTPDLPIGGVAAAALYILASRATGGDPESSGLILFLSLASAVAAAAAGNAVYRRWYAAASSIHSKAMDFASKGRLGMVSAIHLSTLIPHFLLGLLIIAVSLLVGRPLICLITERLRLTAHGSFHYVYLVVPFIGIGSMVRLHGTRARLFWLCAGFLATYIFLLAGS